MKAKVINLFSGPGSGKSTTAAGLFYQMKMKHMNVELITEFAKDLVWAKNFTELEDQLYVTAQQNRRMWRLGNQVDWIITDSPLLLGMHYAPADYFPKFYKDFVFEVYDHYNNINFFIERNSTYDPLGRNQTAEEAIEVDSSIKNILNERGVKYISVDANANIADNILHYLKENNL